MKSYTDLGQSRKLAKILPLESADMYYELIITDDHDAHYRIPQFKRDNQKSDSTDISCWSLAALLSVLPNENMLVKTIDGEYYCLAKDVMTKHYDNPVDAYVAMIEKLHELNLL